MNKALPSLKTNLTYLVTVDLEASMVLWQKQLRRSNIPLTLPKPEFYRQLRIRLKRILTDTAFKGKGVRVEFIDRKQLPHLVKDAKGLDANSYWVSFDEVYVRGADFAIHSTRVYDHGNGTEKLGYGVRPESGERSIDDQYLACENHFKARKLRRRGSALDLVVADDGLFTGDTLLTACQRLESLLSTKVAEVRTGLSTVAGLQKVMKALPYAKIYPGLVTTKIRHRKLQTTQFGLLDWICERDVYAGVPRSGRTLGEFRAETSDSGECRVSSDPVMGKPYIYPFGEISGGASIDHNYMEVSKQFLSSSIILWSHLEKINRRRFRLRDLPRFMGPTKARFEPDLPVTDFLTRIQEEIWGKVPTSDHRITN